MQTRAGLERRSVRLGQACYQTQTRCRQARQGIFSEKGGCRICLAACLQAQRFLAQLQRARKSVQKATADSTAKSPETLMRKSLQDAAWPHCTQSPVQIREACQTMQELKKAKTAKRHSLEPWLPRLRRRHAIKKGRTLGYKIFKYTGNGSLASDLSLFPPPPNQ